MGHPYIITTDIYRCISRGAHPAKAPSCKKCMNGIPHCTLVFLIANRMGELPVLCRGNCVLLQLSRYLAIKFQRGQNLITYLGWQGNLGLRCFDSTILFSQGFRDFLFFQLEELNLSHLFQPFFFLSSTDICTHKLSATKNSTFCL